MSAAAQEKPAGESPPPEPAGRGRPAHLVRSLWPFVRPHWRGFVPVVLGVVLLSVVGLLKPWPLKFLIDDVLEVGPGSGRPTFAALLLIGAAILGIAALQGALTYVKQLFLAATAQKVAYGLRVSLFSHLQRLSVRFHDRQRTGDLMTRVTNDVTKVQELVTDDLLVGGISAVIQLTGMLGVMLVVDWRLGLVATATAPLIVLTSIVFRRRIKSEEGKVREREGDLASLAQQVISSIRVVKSFGREPYESRRFEEQSGRMLAAGVRVARLEATYSLVLGFVTALGLAAVVVYGAMRVLAGALSAGTLVVFIQYMRDLQSPLVSLARLSAKFAKVSVRAAQITAILDERPAVAVRPQARPAPRIDGRVELEHVSFSYAPPALAVHDVSLVIEPGRCLALVGATGAGKSTVAGLLLQLYDPDSGTLRIDGTDVRTLTPQSVIDQIAVVLQESLLFQTTIAENIAYGRPTASRDEIEDAARLAYAHDFIAAQPAGYDTVVGERGTTMSGGQRQRIAVARALIRDARILVLDEPTTGLDARSEAVVLRALSRLMRGRSTLLISHRLEAVRQADQVVVLEHGEVVEQGTPDELVATGTHFRRLFGLADAG